MDWDLGGCRENMFTGPMRCRQANLHHKYLLFLVQLPFTSMQSRTFKANNYLKKKKTITSRAWCKAVKLNSAPHQFTSASAEGLESLKIKWNLIHVHMHWQYWYIYIRFSFTKLSSLHILGILRPSFQAHCPCLCWKKSLGNVWVVQPRCFKQWRWLVVLLQSSRNPQAGLRPSNSDRAWDIDVSKNRGNRKWMVYNGEPYQNGWFGGKTHYFLKHPYLQINAIFNQAGPAMDLPCQWQLGLIKS